MITQVNISNVVKPLHGLKAPGLGQALDRQYKKTRNMCSVKLNAQQKGKYEETGKQTSASIFLNTLAPTY